MPFLTSKRLKMIENHQIIQLLMIWSVWGTNRLASTRQVGCGKRSHSSSAFFRSDAGVLKYLQKYIQCIKCKGRFMVKIWLEYFYSFRSETTGSCARFCVMFGKSPCWPVVTQQANKNCFQQTMSWVLIENNFIENGEKTELWRNGKLCARTKYSPLINRSSNRKAQILLVDAFLFTFFVILLLATSKQQWNKNQYRFSICSLFTGQCALFHETLFRKSSAI